MDKIGVESWEESDEELYALLEQAMEKEPRLQVSEELIRKTLKRVEETPINTGMKEKSYKRFYRPLRYACVVAAAVLVLAIGVKTLGSGVFSAKDNAMEAEFAPEASMRNGSGVTSLTQYAAEEPEYVATADGELPISYCYVLRSVSDLSDGSVTETEEAFDAPEEVLKEMPDFMEDANVSFSIADADATVNVSVVEELYGEALEITLSAEFVTFLEQYGAKDIGTEAIYWNFAETYVSDWENMVLEKLAAGDVQTEGAVPRFTLTNGLMSEQPLQFAVQIQTAYEEYWFVMGEKLYLLRK